MAIELEVAHLYTTLEMATSRWSGELAAAQARWDSMASAMEGRASRAQSAIGSIFGSIGRGISTGIGMALGGDVFSAVAGGIRQAVMGTSDLAETTDAVSRRMGSAFPQVVAFARQLEDQFGLTQGDTLQAAGAFGAFGRQLGLQGPALAGFSNRLVQLAADFSSFENISMRDASEKITSALAGETEPMRRYGVLLSENTIKQYAYARGIASAGSELTEQQKVMARAGAMMEQMRDRSKNLEETQGSFANQLRKLKGMTQVSLRELGAGFSPLSTAIVTGMASNAAGVASAIKALRPQIESFATSAAEAYNRARAAAVGFFGDLWSFGVVELVTDRIRTARDAVSEFVSRAASAGSRFATLAANAAGYGSAFEMLAGAVSWVGRMFEAIRGVSAAYWSGMIAVGDAIARAIGQTDLLTMATSAAGAVLRFVAGWYGRYPALISSATAYVTGLATAFNSWLGRMTGYSSGLDAIGAGVAWLGRAIGTVADFAAGRAQAFIDWLGRVTSYAFWMDTIGAGMEFVAGAISSVAGVVLGPAQALIGWISSASSAAMGLAASFNAWLGYSTGYASGLDAIGNMLTWIWDRLVLAASAGYEVTTWLAGLVGYSSVFDALSAAIAFAWEWVSNLGAVFAGLASAFATLLTPAAMLIGSFIDMAISLGSLIARIVELAAAGAGMIVMLADWVVGFFGFRSAAEAIGFAMGGVAAAIGDVAVKLGSLLITLASNAIYGATLAIETLGAAFDLLASAIDSLIGKDSILVKIDSWLGGLVGYSSGLKALGDSLADAFALLGIERIPPKAAAALEGGGWGPDTGGGWLGPPAGGGWGPDMGGGWLNAPEGGGWGPDTGGGWLGAPGGPPPPPTETPIPLPAEIDPFAAFGDQMEVAVDKVWGPTGKWATAADKAAAEKAAAGGYPDQPGLQSPAAAAKDAKSQVGAFVGLTEYAKKIQAGAMDAKIGTAQLQTAQNTAVMAKHVPVMAQSLQAMAMGAGAPGRILA